MSEKEEMRSELKEQRHWFRFVLLKTESHAASYFLALDKVKGIKI